MQGLQKLVRSYRNLFDSESSNDEEGYGEDDEPITHAEHWGWLATIDQLARGERERWEYFLNMNIVEFFNTLAFNKDKNKDIAEGVHKLIKGKNADEANVLLLAYLIQK